MAVTIPDPDNPAYVNSSRNNTGGGASAGNGQAVSGSGSPANTGGRQTVTGPGTGGTNTNTGAPVITGGGTTVTIEPEEAPFQPNFATMEYPQANPAAVEIRTATDSGSSDDDEIVVAPAETTSSQAPTNTGGGPGGKPSFKPAPLEVSAAAAADKPWWEKTWDIVTDWFGDRGRDIEREGTKFQNWYRQTDLSKWIGERIEDVKSTPQQAENFINSPAVHNTGQSVLNQLQGAGQAAHDEHVQPIEDKVEENKWNILKGIQNFAASITGGGK